MNWIILDLGSYRIKALRADLDGNKIKIHQFVQWPTKPEFFSGLDFPTDTVWGNIGVFLNEMGWLPNEGVAVSAALPASYLETRYLKFPFKSEKKIEKVLPLELESHVPFEVEDILLRHRVLKGAGVQAQKDALVYTMGYKRDLIQKFEAHLRNFQTSIPPISAEILNLLALRSALPSSNGISGILWIGHRKTQLIIFQSSGSILATRTFWWGGADFIQKISRKLKVSEDRAEEIYHRTASFEAGPAIEIELAEALEESLGSFTDELRQFLKGLEQYGLETKANLTVYCGGGPSQISGVIQRIQERFKEEFSINFQDFPIENLMRQVNGLLQVDDPMAAIPAISQLLSQTKTHRSKIPVFSESTFQFQQNIRKIKTQSAALLRKVGILILIPVAYLILSIFIQNQDVKKIRSELQGVLNQNQMKIDDKLSSSEVLKILRAEALDYRKKIDQLQEDQKSPLVALTEISKAIPSRIRIDVKEFRATTDKVYLTLETDSSVARDEIIKSLQTKFRDVKAGGSQACPSFKGCQLISMEMGRRSND